MAAIDSRELAVGTSAQVERAAIEKMSIRALNWAWGWPLTPAPKLILLALADVADDHGVCFPSISFIAKKVTLGKRATQRRIQELASADLIRVELRRRKDGSLTSNRYYLQIDRPSDCGGGVKTTPPPPDRSYATPVNRETRRSVAACAPIPTIETPSDPTTPVVGCESDVIFPVLWTSALRLGAAKCLQGIRADDAQNIVDELVGQMLAKSVTSPLAYLRAIRASYQRGDFYPEVAHRVRAARETQAKQIEVTEAAPQPSSRAAALDAIAKAKARSTRGRKENA